MGLLRLGTDGTTILSLSRGIRNFTTEWRLLIYVLLMAAVAVLAMLTTLALQQDPVSVNWTLCALVIAAAISERWSVRVLSSQLSGYVLPAVLAAVILGPVEAGIVGAAAMLGDPELATRGRVSVLGALRWLLHTSAGCIAGLLAGVAALATDTLTVGSAGTIVLTALTATLAIESCDNTIALVTARVRGRSVRETAARILPIAITSVLVYAPVAGVLAVAYEYLAPWTAILLLAPGLALQRVYTLYHGQRALTDELTVANRRLTEANETLSAANLSFATALVQTLEESDQYTAGHSRAVATYARDIAAHMGLGEAKEQRLYLCGLVHDIGKIGLSGAVLNKEGRLTLEERREMERHSEIGERILEKVAAYADVAKIVRHHHERLDGEGYPDRLRGEEIPLESRIIAVADAYNAMTSDRPYRKAMDYEVAKDRLLQAMGSQFFTAPVMAFLAILADADDAYRYALGVEFGPIDVEHAHDVLVEGASLSAVTVGAA